MSFEADVQRLSQAALDFAERVLQAVVTEVRQPASSERLDELFELCSQHPFQFHAHFLDLQTTCLEIGMRTKRPTLN